MSLITKLKFILLSTWFILRSNSNDLRTINLDMTDKHDKRVFNYFNWMLRWKREERWINKHGQGTINKNGKNRLCCGADQKSPSKPRPTVGNSCLCYPELGWLLIKMTEEQEPKTFVCHFCKKRRDVALESKNKLGWCKLCRGETKE